MIHQLFESVSPRVARSLARQSTEWLRGNRPHVLQMARECGIDSATVDAKIEQLLAASDPSPPTDDPAVDVIIPFHAADSRYLLECLQAMADQKHVHVVAHVVADGCGFPDLSTIDSGLSTIRYRTAGGWGPYRIANSLVWFGHCKAEWLAIQDADDVSYPDRLWRQIQVLRAADADMISSRMRNVVDGSADSAALQKKHRTLPYVVPGHRYCGYDAGSCVNSTRTMRRNYFVGLNGFADFLCGGDTDFDLRARLTGGNIIDDQTLLGDRRLHSRSLSHGIIPIGGSARLAIQSVVRSRYIALVASPDLSLAQSFGFLNRAEPLTVILESQPRKPADFWR